MAWECCSKFSIAVRAGVFCGYSSRFNREAGYDVKGVPVQVIRTLAPPVCERSYPVAHRELIPGTIHSTEQYENNRAEQSHEATRVRERGMRRFKSVEQARRFVTAHAAVSNLFNLGRHLVRAEHYRDLRISAFGEWSRAVA